MRVAIKKVVTADKTQTNWKESTTFREEPTACGAEPTTCRAGPTSQWGK